MNVSALGSFTGGGVSVALSGSPFSAPTMTVTGALAPDIENFGRITPTNVVQVLNQVGNWLGSLSQSAALNPEIPFANGTEFSEVVNLAQAFSQAFTSQLVDADGDVTFASAQQLVQKIATLLNMPESAVAANYNSSTNQLTFFLRMDRTLPSVNAPIEFDLNLAPLGGLATSSQLSIGANGKAQFTLGFDLSPFAARLVAATAAPANGVLTSAATFYVSVDGAPAVLVTVPPNAANTNRTQLATQINAALVAAGLPKVIASFDGAGKLNLNYASGTLVGARLDVVVPDVATNTAATQLGLQAVMENQSSLLSRTFLRDIRATATANLNATIDATANFGFFGVGIEGGTITGNATLDVAFRDPANTTRSLSIEELFKNLNNIATWGQVTSTGTASGTLPITVSGNLLTLTGSPRVTFNMPNVFTPNTATIQFPDLQPLLNYQNLDLGDVVAGIQQLATYLTTIEGFSFLGTDLPLLNRSITDLISFVDRLKNAGNALQGAAPVTIQSLESAIENAFGIAPGDLSLVFADNDLRFNLHLGASLPASLQNIPMDLDLAKLASQVPGGVANLAGVGNLIDVGGTGKLSVAGGADFNLVFGFDLATPSTPRIYIADDTNLALNAQVTGSNLDFNAAVGPLGLFIRNGSARLDNGAGGAATFTAGFKPIAGDRYFSNSWNTSALNVALVGSAGATLPVFFPTEANPLGGVGNNNIVFNVGNLATPTTTTTLTAPPIALEIGSIDLFNNLSSLVSGIDFLLTQLQDALDGEIYGINLPMIGDALKDRAKFINDLRQTLVAGLNAAFGNGTGGANFVRQTLADLLGDTGAGILKDANSDGMRDLNDIEAVATNDAQGKAQRMDFKLGLAQALTFTQPVGFDIGLPGLGLQASDNSAVQLKLGYDFTLDFGVSRTDGVYFDTSGLDELKVNVEASIPNMTVGGELGFLRVRIKDDPTAPSNLAGGFAVDIKDANNRLTFNELAGGNVNLATLFDPKFNLTGAVNLKMELGAAGSSGDVANADFLSKLFPKLRADYNLLWVFDPLHGKLGNLQKAEFNHVGVDVGTLFKEFLQPILDPIAAALEPFQPIIEVLNTPIPVVSDIAGEPITLIDLATSYFVSNGTISPETADFIEQAVRIAELIDTLDEVIDAGFIDFGGFDLKTADLRNPNFNLATFDLTGKVKAPAISVSEQLEINAGSFKAKRAAFQDVAPGDANNNRGELSIPLLDNPLSAFGLLLGKPVTLFQYELPKLEFGYSFEYRWPTPIFVVPTPIGPIPIFGGLTGGMSVGAQLGFGYDTTGLTDFAESSDPRDLLNGFFITDWDSSGNDRKELYISGYLGAFAEAELVIVAAGAEGGVTANVGLNLHDPNNDGKLHGREFYDLLALGGPLCLFDVQGGLGLYLDLFVKIKLPWPLPDIKLSVPIVPEIELISFDEYLCGPAPVLATLQEDGTLLLNMGPRAAQRLHVNTTDGDESFEVKALSSDSVQVKAFGYTQIYGPLGPSPDPNDPSKFQPPVLRIVGNGGNGDDIIVIGEGVPIPVELDGGAGDDKLYAGGAAAVIRGGSGKDFIQGSEFADMLSGDDGDDEIWGGEGDDEIHGGGGADLLGGQGGADAIWGDTGIDRLLGGDGGDVLRGGADGDELAGEGGDDILEGEGGDDLLVGGAGTDRIYGFSITGAGDDNTRDRLYGDFGDGTGGGAKDFLYGQGGDDLIHGEDGDDEIHGGTGADEIFGDAGVDLIFGDSGADAIRGGSGRDTIFAGTESDWVQGDSGEDLIYGESGDDTLLGGTDGDTIHGGTGGDVIRGQEGDDQLSGEDGDDSIYGDAGEDSMFGGLGADLMVGGAGDDRARGGDGDDSMYGGAGRDMLYGETGLDAIYGNEGDDYIDLGTGADAAWGGAGNDVLVAGMGVGKRLFGEDGDDLLIGSDEGGEDGNFNDLAYFGDRLDGGAGDDRIYGLGGADLIRGGTGDDTIDGGANGDLAFGDAGFDTIYGSFGADQLFGGGDNDVLDGGYGADVVRGEAGDDVLYGGGGVGDDLGGGDGDDILYGSEDGADVMAGDAGRDRLYGRAGNDVLRGGIGEDILDGGLGDDLLEGGSGDDVLLGGANHDILYGHLQSGAGDDNAVDWLYGDFGTDGNEAGSGGDQLFGQAGNDVLFGEGGDDAITAGGGASNIVNFGAGEGADPTAFVTPAATPAPSVVVTTTDPRSGGTLPAASDYEAWWGEFAGSASGGGVSASPAAATEASLAMGAAARYVAWADARNGSFEIYVAQFAGGAWSALGGSANGGGIAPSTGGSRRPSIAFDATTGSPVVAWTEIAASGSTDIRVARWNAATLAWEGVGSSLSATGISGTGNADNARVVMTAQGPVVAWVDTSSGAAQVYAKRFVAGNWIDLAAGSSSGSGLSAAGGGIADLAVATDGTKVAVGYVVNGDIVVREVSGGVVTPSGTVLATSGASTTPTLAYHQGSLFAAWADDSAGRAQVYVMSNAGGGWTPAGAGAASGDGVSATLGRSVAPRLAANGGELWLVWGNDESVGSEPGNPVELYVKRWNGSAFVERLAGDASGYGVDFSGGRIQDFALAVDATGAPFLSWTELTGAGSQVYLRGNTLNGANVYTASTTAQLQDLLDNNDFGSNDVILLGPGNFGAITIGGNDAGVTIIGAAGKQTTFTGAVTVAAADVTLQRLKFGAGVTVTAADVDIVDNAFTGGQLVVSRRNGDPGGAQHVRRGAARRHGGQRRHRLQRRGRRAGDRRRVHRPHPRQRHPQRVHRRVVQRRGDPVGQPHLRQHHRRAFDRACRFGARSASSARRLRTRSTPTSPASSSSTARMQSQHVHDNAWASAAAAFSAARLRARQPDRGQHDRRDQLHRHDPVQPHRAQRHRHRGG